MRIPVRTADQGDDGIEKEDRELYRNGRSTGWPHSVSDDGSAPVSVRDLGDDQEAGNERVGTEQDRTDGEDGVWKDRYVRLLADFENHKRHAQAERERLAGIGKEAVLEDLFPLVEAMEMARKAVAAAANRDAILSGLDLVSKQITAMLAKHGVERIKTVGESFDPSVHEALAVVPGQGAGEDTVIEELKPGFRRDGKLLRPAGVVVAK